MNGTLLNFNDCYDWRELPALSLRHIIDCASCIVAERLIMNVIVGVILCYCDLVHLYFVLDRRKWIFHVVFFICILLSLSVLHRRRVWKT